ncbi:MAG: hypothetical protein ABI635_03105 [Actinomycetota bacterium]
MLGRRPGVVRVEANSVAQTTALSWDTLRRAAAIVAPAGRA